MKKTLLIVISFLFSLSTMMQAATYRVNNNVGISADFSTLDDAYDAASDGDSLYLEGSSINYSINTSVKKSLTFIGPGYNFEDNDITNYSQLPAIVASNIALYASGITLKGIVVKGCVHIYGSNIVINRCILDMNMALQAIHLGADVSNLVLHQNVINGKTESNAFYASNSLVTNNIIYTDISYFKNSIIEYNTFIARSELGFDRLYGNDIRNNLFLTNLGEVKIYNSSDNKLQNNFDGNYPDCLSGTNYNLYDDKFESTFRPKEGLSIMTMSTNGDQLGAYGGKDPYVLSGIPDIPVIREVSAPTTANKTDGLPVSIVITSHQ